jgi:hypothetical protein
MPRQPQLNGPIQVVGHAAQQGLLDLLPVAPRCDRPAKPALNHRDECLDFPPLAICLAGKSQLQLASIGVSRHATRWPPRDRGNNARDAQVLTQPAVVGLGIVAAIGQQTRRGQPSQGLCHQGAKLNMVPARPAIGDLATQDQRVGPDGYRPLQPRAGAIACPKPAVGNRGWPGHAQSPWNPW